MAVIGKGLDLDMGEYTAIGPELLEDLAFAQAARIVKTNIIGNPFSFELFEGTPEPMFALNQGHTATMTSQNGGAGQSGDAAADDDNLSFHRSLTCCLLVRPDDQGPVHPAESGGIAEDGGGGERA